MVRSQFSSDGNSHTHGLKFGAYAGALLGQSDVLRLWEVIVSLFIALVVLLYVCAVAMCVGRDWRG